MIYIFDIEVFENDWLFKARSPDDHSPFVTIWNDNARLKSFLSQQDLLLGGFNNKHYDNWVMLTMIEGGSNIEVKRHNDYIIAGNNAWEFPFIQYKRLPCKTFDLRDDIADPAISLKAIEGNLKLPIVESSIPFDYKGKLNDEQRAEIEKYCEYDVNSTVKLYWSRKENYLDAKSLVAEMYNIPIPEALGLTNAKLSARVLGAKKTERTDERNYTVPSNIDLNYVPEVVKKFFEQIHDETIPDSKLFGDGSGKKGLTLDIILKTSYGECPVSYAWGGVHGAKPCVTIEENAERVIINQDVGSLYPNSMINFGYCSRSMEDPNAYEKLVQKRLGYKHAGDKTKAKALKLVVNTVYGAMLNAFNDLADKWAGRSVCITNQLAMTVLIVQLAQQCETIDFVNINTDGVMFTIDRKEIELSEAIVASWCEITKFEMERDDFVKVIQKDVNNYIGITPEGKMKTKGAYVSLYKGGNFKTNSLTIIHKAIVEKLVNGIEPEETIKNCKDIFEFQNIIKTGGSYEGTYHYVNGVRENVQKVNRVYAVKDIKYGAVVKGKLITEKRKKNSKTGKFEITPVNPPVWSETIISECPQHCYIDNENKLSIEQLDLDYYIDIAKKRIDKYINIDSKVANRISKIKKEVVIMTTKENAKTVYTKLAEARKKYLASGVKKSGKNVYAGFKYYELEDIVPVANQIFNDLELVLIPTITFDEVSAKLVDTGTEAFIEFKLPAGNPNIEQGTKMSAIQGMGAYITYMRRYIYNVVLDIVENDVVDAVINKPDANAPQALKPASKPLNAEDRENIKDELVNPDGDATKTQRTAITAGLKKLRARYMNDDKIVFDSELEDKYDNYITSVVKRVKTGVTKAEADEILIDIGQKIEE